MNCPHLVKDIIYTCESGAEPLPPGTTSLRKLCKGSGHRTCPLYLENRKSLGFYYELDPAA